MTDSPRIPAIHTDEAPRPVGAYSQGRVAGPFVFTAGLGPLDPATGQVTGDDVATQTDLVLDHLTAVLRQAGATLDDVVKVTVHLQDPKRDFAEFDRTYRARFREPFPVRTTVGSTLAGILVEIDVVAYTG
ncbi:MAG TPA: Rid family hydrolase [Pseudonocardiaceae bacterium]|nr:Rid family hydrolase [Pseudonocardiaceae bacterium]